jgi:uncharacterized membrane protein
MIDGCLGIFATLVILALIFGVVAVRQINAAARDEAAMNDEEK